MATAPLLDPKVTEARKVAVLGDSIPTPAGTPKVDIALFTYRYASVLPILGIYDMHLRARRDGIDSRLVPYGSALIDHARALAVAEMRADADAILFVDDDMVPPIERSVVKKLMDLNVDVVAPLFTTRAEPVTLTVKKYDRETDSLRAVSELSEAADNKILTGDLAVGMAFTLIRREALQKVVEYHISARDWLDDNRPMFDRLRVRAENRETERKRVEEKRRADWRRNRSNNLFDRAYTAAGEKLGEDIAFCRRLLRAGVHISLDCRLEMAVGHAGQHAFGVWDIGTPNNRHQFGQLFMDDPATNYEMRAFFRTLQRANQ